MFVEWVWVGMHSNWLALLGITKPCGDEKGTM